MRNKVGNKVTYYFNSVWFNIRKRGGGEELVIYGSDIVELLSLDLAKK